MAQKYVRCDSHCKYPAYSKDEVDALVEEKLETKTEKNDFALIKQTITTDADGRGSVMVDFPEGFTKNNCMVLSTDYMYVVEGTDTNARMHNTGNVPSSETKNITNPFVCLGELDKISIYLEGTTGGPATIETRVLLMKVGE